MIKVLYLAFPREFCLTHSICSESIVWRSWGSVSELYIETFGVVVVLGNEKLWMFEGWDALHHPHSASVTDRLDTWCLGPALLPQRSCVTLTMTPGHCSVPSVSCHPSQMLCASPGDFAKLCIAQFCLCKNTANIYFVWRQRGRGKNHSDITLCCVCSHRALPTTGVTYLPAASQSLVHLGVCPTSFCGGRWSLLLWAVKGTTDFCICCFSCGFWSS